MKLFKRIITVAVCSVVATLCFSGCDAIFGNRCKHHSGTRGSDDQTHYSICDDCGEKYDVENHVMNTSSDKNNTTQHYRECVRCGYRDSYEPHEFSGWNYDTANSVRRCTVSGCSYEEQCNHYGTTKYVVADEFHYTECENCARKLTEKSPHTFTVYSDVTETAHTLSCECGKISDEGVPHGFKYKTDHSKNHWQVCDCGYETEKVACNYGSFTENENDDGRHYAVCSVCEDEYWESHSYELTGSKRLCVECLHEKKPYALFIGVWKFNSDRRVIRLTLSENWTYTMTYTDGEIIDKGVYDVSYYVGLKGDITGRIYLDSETPYQNTAIDYEFKKGVTNKFTDSNNRTYSKQ